MRPWRVRGFGDETDQGWARRRIDNRQTVGGAPKQGFARTESIAGIYPSSKLSANESAYALGIPALFADCQ